MATSKRTPATTLPAEEIPEVQELIEVEKAIEEHLSNNKEWYAQLQELVELRNTKLEQADKVVRPLGVSCGPFRWRSATENINAEKLYEELGLANFKNVGGYTETVTIFKVDRTRFQSHADRGDIPKEVKDAVLTKTNSYSKIDPYRLP